MELKLEAREWYFNLAIESGEVPDIQKRYTKAIVFRPESATIKLTTGPDNVFRMARVTVRGPRVLRNGLGEQARDDFYQQGDLPEWLYPVITRAILAAKADITHYYPTAG